MVEDLIEMFIKDFQKYNITGVCVLRSSLFNQYFPDSKITKRYFIRKKICYCLHVWIEFENEFFDIGNMLHLLGNPQYPIKEPFRSESIDCNFKKMIHYLIIRMLLKIN